MIGETEWKWRRGGAGGKREQETQQFRRPLAGHCKYRIQSRIRVDNETCIHDHRKDEFFETAPSETVREFHLPGLI